MIRLQIDLTEQQLAALRWIADSRKVAVTDLIRSSIDSFLLRETTATREDLVERAKAVLGRFESGLPSIGTNHDAHLGEAFASKLGPLTEAAEEASPAFPA